MDLEVTWPAWLGAGIAFKPFNGKFILTSDLQFTNWRELDILYAKIKKMQVGPETFKDVEQEMHLEWVDAIQLRFGAQYVYSEKLTLRMGYYYDPAPALDKTLNILFPSSTSHAYTAGGTYLINKFNIDFGLEYLYGNERNALPTDMNMPGLHQMDVFAYSLGLGYNF